jgi:type I restriction enzyme R subunit
MDALVLFKGDLGTFLRLYTFLSQIFNYGNTDIEKRAIFYKLLLPLLDFGREREGIDLSKITLARHRLIHKGKRALPLNEGEADPLKPIEEAGSGAVQEKQRALMAELLDKLNDLFGTDTTDDDKLIYVNGVIMGKLLESETLQKQAANNSKEQFATSPDLDSELNDAIIDALDAHSSMSSKALNSKEVKRGMLDILLNHTDFWEKLRDKAS